MSTPRTITADEARAFLSMTRNDLARTVVDLHDRLDDAQRVIAAGEERIEQLQSELANARSHVTWLRNALALLEDAALRDRSRNTVCGTCRNAPGAHANCDDCRVRQELNDALQRGAELLEESKGWVQS